MFVVDEDEEGATKFVEENELDEDALASSYTICCRKI